MLNREMYAQVYESFSSEISAMDRNDRNALLSALSLQQYFAYATPSEATPSLIDSMGRTIEDSDDHTTDAIGEILERFTNCAIDERMLLICVVATVCADAEGVNE
jgi:hypothetical protein